MSKACLFSENRGPVASIRYASVASCLLTCDSSCDPTSKQPKRGASRRCPSSLPLSSTRPPLSANAVGRDSSGRTGRRRSLASVPAATAAATAGPERGTAGSSLRPNRRGPAGACRRWHRQDNHHAGARELDAAAGVHPLADGCPSLSQHSADGKPLLPVSSCTQVGRWAASELCTPHCACRELPPKPCWC